MTCGLQRGGLIHYLGGCYNCDAEWSSRNVIGLAAQHHKKYGHDTWAETGHAYTFGRPSASAETTRILKPED